MLLPPSETKHRPESGPNFDLSRIHPISEDLARTREEILTALIETSARPEALEILKVGKSLEEQVRANLSIETRASAPAWQVYTGVLYDAAQLSEGDYQGPAGSQQNDQTGLRVCVQSALLGIVDLNAPITDYRLSMDVTLPGVGGLATRWRPTLKPVMDQMAHHDVVVDCRSGAYAAAWPGLDGEHELVKVKAVRVKDGRRRVVSHWAKRFRGLLTGEIIRNQPESNLAALFEVAQNLVVKEGIKRVDLVEGTRNFELVIEAQ